MPLHVIKFVFTYRDLTKNFWKIVIDILDETNLDGN